MILVFYRAVRTFLQRFSINTQILQRGRKVTVVLRNVTPRIRLSDHALVLAASGVGQRPQLRILTIAQGSYWWSNIGWYTFFDAPNNANTPIFIHATNEPLPSTWVEDISGYISAL